MTLHEPFTEARSLLVYTMKGLLLIFLSCLMFAQCIVAQNDDWQFVSLSELNSVDDEVLIGWDGQAMYFSRSERSLESKGTSAWFREEKIDWESARLEGWSNFSQPESVVLRAFYSAEWPGFEAIQHVAIDPIRGVLVMSAAVSSEDDFDLYMAQESSAGWSAPIPLLGLNTDGDEVYPNFQDGTLLFACDGRPEGLGGFDVYQSLRTDNYQSAQPLPPPLNSQGDELAAIPAGDSWEAGFYLSASRAGSTGMDLWWVGPPSTEENIQADFALEFRHLREPLSGLDVVIQERGGGLHVFSGPCDEQGRVSIGNVPLDAAMTVKVSPRLAGRFIPDGAVCHVFERCLSTSCLEEYWPGWKLIRSYRMEGGTAFVFDLLPLDALGRWPRPHAGDASRLEVIPNWTGRFEKSRFELSENDQEEMRKWLNKAKSTEGNWPIHRRLLIEGHTDANGSFEGNNILSLSRATHAKRLVVSAGLSAEYITCIAKGDAEVTGVPKLDRRVELRWVPAE
jgi:hypothetical protein